MLLEHGLVHVAGEEGGRQVIEVCDRVETLVIRICHSALQNHKLLTSQKVDSLVESSSSQAQKETFFLHARKGERGICMCIILESYCLCNLVAY